MFSPDCTSHQIDSDSFFSLIFFFFFFIIVFLSFFILKNLKLKPMFNGQTERVHLDKYGHGHVLVNAMRKGKWMGQHQLHQESYWKKCKPSNAWNSSLIDTLNVTDDRRFYFHSLCDRKANEKEITQNRVFDFLFALFPLVITWLRFISTQNASSQECADSLQFCNEVSVFWFHQTSKCVGKWATSTVNRH